MEEVQKWELKLEESCDKLSLSLIYEADLHLATSSVSLYAMQHKQTYLVSPHILTI